MLTSKPSFHLYRARTARLPLGLSYNAPASVTSLNLQTTEELRACPQALGDDKPTRLAKGCGDAWLSDV